LQLQGWEFYSVYRIISNVVFGMLSFSIREPPNAPPAAGNARPGDVTGRIAGVHLTQRVTWAEWPRRADGLASTDAAPEDKSSPQWKYAGALRDRP
jgi:hypothetical protein